MSHADDNTIPSRDRLNDTPAPPTITPWALQSYFDGEIDLIQDLAARYPQTPIMSLFHTRTSGERSPRALATVATQDGAASMILEIDVLSRAIQLSFIMGSLVGVRFRPGALSRLDRAAWIEPMRRETGEVAFLWNARRWEQDYIISAATKTFTYLFAFSSGGNQAAARITPEVTRKLLDWIAGYW
ncbi:MAG: hypothetical protein SGJ24_00675 [Chloroflexota bacterium]|nr:hypothetical protein [Chloroflexota bacterium]